MIRETIDELLPAGNTNTDGSLERHNKQKPCVHRKRFIFIVYHKELFVQYGLFTRELE